MLTINIIIHQNLYKYFDNVRPPIAKAIYRRVSIQKRYPNPVHPIERKQKHFSETLTLQNRNREEQSQQTTIGHGEHYLFSLTANLREELRQYYKNNAFEIAEERVGGTAAGFEYVPRIESIERLRFLDFGEQREGAITLPRAIEAKSSF